VVAALSISHSLLRMVGSILSAWLTLGWNVRSARKAFEAELRKEGMSKKDAERLSKVYSVLKNEMMNIAKKSFTLSRKKPSS